MDISLQKGEAFKRKEYGGVEEALLLGDDEEEEKPISGIVQVIICAVVFLNAMYWTCLFPIKYDVAKWVHETRVYGSLLVGLLYAVFPAASYLFKRLVANWRMFDGWIESEGDLRPSYLLWTVLLLFGAIPFTILLCFPNWQGTTILLIVIQIIGGSSQAVIYVARQAIVLMSYPKNRVFYYALYIGANDGGAAFGILFTGILFTFSENFTLSFHHVPLYLILPTFCVSIFGIALGSFIQIFHPRHPYVVPEEQRQLKKPPPVTVDGAWGLSPDNRRRLCISSCYLVGFNRVMIKTMWLSTAIDVWKDIFSFSELNSCIALFFTVFLGICVQQTVAYNSHILPDRSWMAISEIGILSSLFISLIVSKFLLNFRFYALALFLYSFSSFFLYMSCMINANVTNAYATKYAIRSDSNFDQAAISITQTILQNCLGKVLAPILATIFGIPSAFLATVSSTSLSLLRQLSSPMFIIGSINVNNM